MAVVIDDQNFYKTAEACRMTSISKDALFKCLKERIISDVESLRRAGLETIHRSSIADR